MNFKVEPHTGLLVIAGSRAYGTFNSDSDVDVKGVCVPPRNYTMGFLHHFENADKPSEIQPFFDDLTPEEQAISRGVKLEGTIYEVRKFCRLAAGANPNILDVLFCREEEVRRCSGPLALLREHRDLFLSAKAKHTFSGYAISQLNRIKGHRKWIVNPPTHKPFREEFGLPEKAQIPTQHRAAMTAEINKQIDIWLGEATNIDGIDLPDLPMQTAHILKLMAATWYPGRDGADKESIMWDMAARYIGLGDNVIEIMQKEREFKSAAKNYKSYLKWKRERNPARYAMEIESGFDRKHGMHLVRLLRCGREILTTGKVNVWRGGIDAEELKAIRYNGAWSYDQLVEWAEQQDKDLNALYREKNYAVPHAPDMAALDQLCVDIVKQSYKEIT